MNLQIIGEKSTRKIIAVADDAMDRDDLTVAILRQIMAHCGLDDRYQVVSAGELGCLTGRWTPYAWVAEDHSAPPSGEFSICVSDYDGRATGDNGGCHYTTFSTVADGADFVARNIRRAKAVGYTFDLVGLGIIGRIHLQWNDPHLLRSTLVAASAALSCGVSFADVVEVLNDISTQYRPRAAYV